MLADFISVKEVPGGGTELCISIIFCTMGYFFMMKNDEHLIIYVRKARVYFLK